MNPTKKAPFFTCGADIAPLCERVKNASGFEFTDWKVSEARIRAIATQPLSKHFCGQTKEQGTLFLNNLARFGYKASDNISYMEAAALVETLFDLDYTNAAVTEMLYLLSPIDAHASRFCWHNEDDFDTSTSSAAQSQTTGTNTDVVFALNEPNVRKYNMLLGNYLIAFELMFSDSGYHTLFEHIQCTQKNFHRSPFLMQVVHTETHALQEVQHYWTTLCPDRCLDNNGWPDWENQNLYLSIPVEDFKDKAIYAAGSWLRLKQLFIEPFSRLNNYCKKENITL